MSLALCPSCGTLVGDGGCDDCRRDDSELTYRSGKELGEFLRNQLDEDDRPSYISSEFNYVSRQVDQPQQGDIFQCRYCSNSFEATEADELVEHILDNHASETLSSCGPFSPTSKQQRRRSAGKCLSCGAKIELNLARPVGQVRIGCSRRSCHSYYLAGTLHEEGTDRCRGYR